MPTRSCSHMPVFIVLALTSGFFACGKAIESGLEGGLPTPDRSGDRTRAGAIEPREIEGFAYLGPDPASAGGTAGGSERYLHVKSGLVFVLVPAGRFMMEIGRASCRERV